MSALQAAPAIETNPLDAAPHAVTPTAFSGLPPHLEQRRE